MCRLRWDRGSRPWLDILLLWGIGLGILTPAVVTTAIGAVPAGRSVLASAVNNTARQACGAIGIAAFGAIAGQPGSHNFIPGLHTVGLVTAALFLAGGVTTLVMIRQSRSNEVPPQPMDVPPLLHDVDGRCRTSGNSKTPSPRMGPLTSRSPNAATAR